MSDLQTKQETQVKFRPHIGMRNMKTAISATLVAFLYFLIKRNPTFACIGAVFGMGNAFISGLYTLLSGRRSSYATTRFHFCWNNFISIN